MLFLNYRLQFTNIPPLLRRGSNRHTHANQLNDSVTAEPRRDVSSCRPSVPFVLSAGIRPRPIWTVAGLSIESRHVHRCPQLSVRQH